VGAGSNELIDLLVQTFVEPGDEVLAPAYSFACYRLSAEAHGRAFCEAPLSARFRYDVEAILAAVTPRTKLLFLANPNNPTGTYLPAAELSALVARVPARVIVAIDEAYFEYARATDYPNALTHMGARARLCVLRTFSKVYGLAGLRVGYLVAPEEITGFLHRVRLPFNVNAVAQAAARAALEDSGHVAHSVRSNGVERGALASALARLEMDVLPSQGNFLLAGAGATRNAKTIFDGLLRRGVIVRPMGAYGLPGHLRITVGTASENARLCAALAEVLA
jgi:histidinol-phosphate aminotransferase